MRSALLSFTIVAAFAATSALAQTRPGYGANGYGAPGYAPPGYQEGMVPAPPSHQPMSRQPTNINGADTRSVISPSLPDPGVGPNADASRYLRAAARALRQGETGEAQAALGEAETFLLNRSVPQGATDQPDTRMAVRDIDEALQALAANDRGRVMELIDQTIPMTGQGMMGADEGSNGSHGAPPAMRDDYGSEQGMNGY